MSVVSSISTNRFKTYLRASGHNEERAFNLYIWNILISESFYPVLSVVEVCLRDFISNKIISIYGNRWWEDQGFINIIGDGKGILKRSGKKLLKSGQVTSDRMVAELSFGFWVKMLLPKHKTTIWNNFPNDFPHLPQNITYEDLYDICNEICDFRNRIFHHETIIKYDISLKHQKILNMIKWISPEKEVWIRKYSRVHEVLKNKNKKFESFIKEKPENRKVKLTYYKLFFSKLRKFFLTKRT